jgi:hypothetical protein
MKSKINVMTALLLTTAIILSQAIPSFSTIPDYNAIILIIIIVLNNNYKKTLIYGLLFGILSALITKASNGQIPNLADKFITANTVYILMNVFKNFDINKYINMVLFISLFVSNLVFYTLWFLLNGLFINDHVHFIFLELVFIILILSSINAIIANMIFKLVNRCININYNNLDN